jgi:hypothetical protein
VFPKIFIVTLLALLPVFAFAQQAPPGTPPVKVNVLNVCSPSADEQKEMASALTRVPKQPQFVPDFEIARGRSSLSDKAALLQAAPPGSTSQQPLTAAWVRIRREFSPTTSFSTVQYSFSADANEMIETLTLHVRDPKDLVQLSIEDNASAVASPANMLGTNTPVGRIRLERFGKASVVLARCAGTEGSPPPDQTAYEPLFRTASSVLDHYRDVLGARRTVPEELAKVVTSGKSKIKPAAAAPGNKGSKPKPPSSDR